ncbi:MAG: hypothetical protein KQH59_06535 [Desulfobulbaceae bacterium]|nr:hypothetical protein [Desulfobulbaceae bacterium]
MRKLSDDFLNDLRIGLLQPLLVRVKQDNTLMLAIRDGYINIYYRGGNIIRVKSKSNGRYSLTFDLQYNIFSQNLPYLPAEIVRHDDVETWVQSLPQLKEIMDFYFSAHPKPEREFQQLVARENNDSTISNASEYFISDIEFADSELGARFDMLAIRWLASQRKDGNKCKAALIEMKYADGALDGNAGLLKHLKDIDDFIGNRPCYENLMKTMVDQFNQLDQLGLLKFNKGKSNAKVSLDVNDKPELIFILANHNPRSKKLKRVLDDPQIELFDKSKNFDLRFYTASYAGYGLHKESMVTLNQFRQMMNK